MLYHNMSKQRLSHIHRMTASVARNKAGGETLQYIYMNYSCLNNRYIRHMNTKLCTMKSLEWLSLSPRKRRAEIVPR